MTVLITLAICLGVVWGVVTVAALGVIAWSWSWLSRGDRLIMIGYALGGLPVACWMLFDLWRDNRMARS